MLIKIKRLVENLFLKGNGPRIIRDMFIRTIQIYFKWENAKNK